VICDYHLDFGETGIEWYQDIQPKLPPQHIAILTTADRSIEIRELSNKYGLLYLPKPIKPIALKHLLNRHQFNLI
jgi:DNA-binding NarL/FixJ family response regulator